jgi:hypothetical protein
MPREAEALKAFAKKEAAESFPDENAALLSCIPSP